MSSGYATAERVSVWTQPGSPAPFRAWGEALRAAFEVPQDDFAVPAEPAPDLDSLRAQAFADGMAQGLAQGRAEADAERAALHRLAGSLDALQPEPTQALGQMIAATVERLLGELMGRVEIDRDALIARAQAAAALIGEETRPAVLKLHPQDAARLDGADLPVTIEADASIAPGALRLETAAGWIEDGPAVRLERLRVALDRVAAAR